MTNEALFSAIGDLDETIIAEAETQHQLQMMKTKRTGIKAAAVALGCAACIGLILIGGMNHSTSDSPDTPSNHPSQLISIPTDPAETTPTETVPAKPPVAEQEHCITLLHAIGDGSQKTELIENVSFPYHTLIRTRDISGIDDEQFSAVLEEEQKFIDSFFSQYPKEALNCWGRHRGDDVLITTLSAGSFILQLDNPDEVESLEISVTDMGHMSLHQRVEDYWCVATNHHSIYLDEKGLEQAIQPSEQSLTMFWNMSNQAASMIKENPTLPLSSLHDTITIRLSLKDGSEETCSIDMIVDDSGNVYAVYNGLTVTA